MPDLELNPANAARGFSTPYYMAKTNSGDDAGAVWVGEGQNIRLIDPSTGQVIATGVGQEGAKNLVSQANSLSGDQGRKAQWAIQADAGGGNWTTQAYDRADPKKNLLKTLIRVAAPILGTMIPIPGVGTMLGNALGAALGGAVGTGATGGSLKQSLLTGALSGLGAGAGQFLGGSLSGLGGGSSSGSLLGGIGDDVLGAATGGFGSNVGTLLPELLVPGVVGGGLGGGVGGALGGGLGGLAGGAFGGAGGGGGGGADTFSGGEGTDQLTSDPVQDELVPMIDPVTITAPEAGPSITGLPFPSGLVDGLIGPPNAEITPFEDQQQDFDPSDLLDLLGGQQQPPSVFGGGQLPWWLMPWTPPPGGGGTPPPGTQLPGSDAPPGGPGSRPMAPGAPGGAMGGPGVGLKSAGTGGSSGVGTGGGAPLDIKGSLAPDIYPWSTGGL